MEAASKPKVDFYTPATFKRVAEQFGQMLTATTGFTWRMHGVTKSNRKTIEGQELYLLAKFYPEDKSNPSMAELSASLTSGFGRQNYLAQAVVEHRTRPVFEESHSSQQFSEIAQWVTSLKLAPATSEMLKQAKGLIARVVSGYVRSLSGRG